MSRDDLMPFPEVARRLADRIDDLVSELLPCAELGPGRDPLIYRVGSVWGEPGGSMVIWRRGAKQGEWADFASGAAGEKGGDALHLVRACRRLPDVVAAKRWAMGFLGLSEREAEDPAKRAARIAEGERRKMARAAERERNRQRMAGLAQQHFLAAQPIAGTPAEAYLRGRAIDLAALEHMPGALRFHPAMRCPERAGMARPCMLAAVYRYRAKGPAEFLTVHRTFLAELPGGRWVKASHADAPGRMEDAKQAYSDFHGGFIALWRGDSNRSFADMRAREWIVASEGIEDALSWACADPSLRSVATVTLGNLAKIEFPAMVEGVFWHCHQGDGPQAQAALAQGVAAQAARGVAVKPLLAPGGFKDVNEWLMAQAVTAWAKRKIRSPNRSPPPRRRSRLRR